MKEIKSDITIIGAGPAGATVSLFLSKKEIPHIIIDKSTFPRDKTCGDGYTPEVARVLREIDEELFLEFINGDWVEPSYGTYLGIENNKGVMFDFTNHLDGLAPYYVAKRLDFDNFLVEKLPSDYAKIYFDYNVTAVVRENDQVHITANNKEETIFVTSKLVIGADGERSIVKKSFHPNGLKKNRDHYVGALRCYCKNVKKVFDNNPLEIYKMPAKYAGYLWIFHLPNNECNVGIGGLSSDISKNNVSLKKELEKHLNEMPELKHRFENATPLETVKGWGIPLNSNAFDYVGDNYLLIGDSGSMGEPLTGKGIGVAMFVAMQSIEVIEKSLKSQKFKKEDLLSFEEAVEKKFRKEWNKLYKWQGIFGKNLMVKGIVSVLSFKPLNKILAKYFANGVDRFINKPYLVNRDK